MINILIIAVAVVIVAIMRIRRRATAGAIALVGLLMLVIGALFLVKDDLWVSGYSIGVGQMLIQTAYYARKREKA